MVSSTGKFIFDFQKNKKLGYPTLILLFVCISNGYRNTTHTGTYTGTYTETYTVTYTEKYCFGVPANRLWFHKIQVVMTWMKRTKRMVWWVSQRFHYKDTTKNCHFQILENICRIPSDKVLYTWTAEGTMEHINTRQYLPVEKIPRTVVVNHVPHERIFESPVFSVIKTQTPKWVSVWVPVWVPV